MKATNDHNVLSSMFLWVDHFLADKGTAYSNIESNFYHYTDVRITDKVIYGSPFKQFIYDDSVSGSIPVTISGDGQLIPKGTSGMKVDYNEGRIIFNSDVSTGIGLSGSYSVKDFNIYTTNQNEEEIVVEGKYKNNSRRTRTLTNVTPYDIATPAIFLSLEGGGNEAFAFGGEDETMTQLKAVILAEDIFHLDGALSIFKDSRELCVSNIPFTGSPLGEYGDIKSGAYPTGFNYNDIAANYNTDNYQLDSVTTSKLSDEVRKEIPSNLFVGFVDFEIKQYRFPRV